MMEDMLASLRLEQTGAHRYLVPRPQDDIGRHVVFGGELLGQAVMAASRTFTGKGVKSVQTVFARGVRTDSPIELEVDPMHEGRNLGSLTVTFRQADRLGARALVLLDVAEPDLVRHAPTAPVVAPPESGTVLEHPLAAPETVIVDDVDINDPELVGPASLQLWVRFPKTSREDDALNKALLSYSTDGWLIATAMRPHSGLGLSMAHVTVSTGVVSHALVFHGAPVVDDWLLIDHSSTFAGGGRCYGKGDVYTRDGNLVATFTQEALLRAFPQGQDPRGNEKSIF